MRDGDSWTEILSSRVRNKFINGMVALQIKHRFSVLIQLCSQTCVAAFPDGTGHFPLLRRMQRMACMDRDNVQF